MFYKQTKTILYIYKYIYNIIILSISSLEEARARAWHPENITSNIRRQNGFYLTPHSHQQAGDENGPSCCCTGAETAKSPYLLAFLRLGWGNRGGLCRGRWEAGRGRRYCAGMRLAQEGLLLGRVRGQGTSPALLWDCRLLAKHQKHQLFLLPAHLRGNVMEAEIVPQVLHLHLHELLTLKGCGSEPLAEQAEAGPIPHLVRTGQAEILLTVQAGLLLRARGRGKHVRCAGQDRKRDGSHQSWRT